MDIGAMSMDMSLVRVQQSAGISISKKIMVAQEVEADGVLKMAEAACPKQVPVNGIGEVIDVRA